MDRNLKANVVRLAAVSVLSGGAALLGLVWPPPAESQGRMAPTPRQTPASAPACSLPVDPHATACTSPDHRGRTLRALQRGFGVQYWGGAYTAAALADAPHGLLIIEATRTGADQAPDNKELLFSRQDIARISHNGARPVLAYVNLAEIEAYRDYWRVVRPPGSDPRQEMVRSWVGPRTERSEQLARYWDPAWETILRNRVDRLMALGFDGVFLDDALHYYTFATQTGLDWSGVDRQNVPDDAPAHALAMMHLITALATQVRSRSCDAIVIVNNAVFIGRDAGSTAPAQAAFQRYREAIDGVLVETVFGSPSRAQVIQVLLDDFQSAGTAILALDFVRDFPAIEPAALRGWLAGRAARDGIVSYLAEDGAFDRLSPPIKGPQPDRQPR